MSVENIKKAVIGDAEKEAEEIVAAAEAAVKERLEKGRHKIENEMGRRLGEAKKELGGKAERRVMQKRSAHNIELLRKRNEILNSVFDLAAKRLKDLDDDAYRELLGGWLQQIPEDAAGEAFCHNKDAKRLEPLIKAINKARPEESEITLATDEEVESGIVFRAESFEIDLTVRTKLNELREELTPEVAGMIFPKNAKV